MEDPAEKIDKAIKKYKQSEKGKQAQEKYFNSDKGKKARDAYLKSEKGQAALLRYRLSPKGQEAYKKYSNLKGFLRKAAKYMEENPGSTLDDFLLTLSKEEN